MLFKKNDSANLGSKSTKYWKNRPQKTKEAQNVVFNLKGRIPYYFTVSNIFTDNLKLIYFRNSLQTNRKNYIPTVGKNLAVNILLKPFCRFCILWISQFVRYYFFWYFIVLYGVLTLYCVLETCKRLKWKVYFLSRHSSNIVLHSILPLFSAISRTSWC